ncbi:MAG: saccharopine dehydrogenase NADP-binding domain-containing protein, partial [Bacteroidia bacterium]|nr:saccharopine dehydrogenase NADP-binding domain-containing protein [Bacteroidia bacterium]
MKVIVLGAGLIGKAIAVDLNSRYDVTCSDIQLDKLELLSKEHRIKTKQADFNDKKTLSQLLEPFDLVVSAVPGFMGYNLLKQIIENKKNCVDISFFPENALELNSLAKEKNVTAIVDCGVAPGLCNIIAGYHHSISKLNSYECLVGGLPKTREWPYEYKAVFSPIDVIEEYTRPARYLENGKSVVREALSDPEYVFFKEIGTLESFNTDGLRTLAETMPDVPNMKEKTLRYPGHISLMKILRDTGFFEKNKISINGQQISPIELTSKLLFPKWKMEPDEEDFTIMQIILENENECITYSLFDKKDIINNISSMAR